MNSEIMVEARDLCKNYGTVTALDHVSFSVNKAELFGFIGPDGAGKTTLLRILATMLKPDTGTVRIGEYDAVNDYRKIRNMIGYMPGKFSLYQDLTVEENLQFFAGIFGSTIKDNYYLINDIYDQISPFKNRQAGKLSGGMKQKLALSCAMIHKPDLLLLDEPTTGVDAVSRKEFWEMLRKRKEDGITIIVSTPYMDEAGKCDRVALFQNSKILSTDTPENITANYGSVLFAVRTSNMYTLIHDLKYCPTVRSAHSFGQYIHYTDKEINATMSDIEYYLRGKGHSEIEIRQIDATVEDCFMRLMLND
ncbi:MAG: ABC transporter ATP-binding protein [Bacteroidia bacterium]|nr:ABC transporter ATP-binding protein [Bacteroidia bacterium]